MILIYILSSKDNYMRYQWMEYTDYSPSPLTSNKIEYGG